MINPIIGSRVIVILSPRTEVADAKAATLSVLSLILNTDRQIEAISADIPLASFTTKVCIEKITLSSRLLFLSSP